MSSAAVTPAAVAAARRYARGRRGLVSFALVDARHAVALLAPHRTYHSASIVKVMLLVGFLRAAVRSGRPITAGDRAVLGRMIRMSDNAAASEIYRRNGGEAGMRRVARIARMHEFTVSGTWGGAFVSAADQASLFLHLDELLPPRERRFAHQLMQSIIPSQRWGIAPVAHAAGWHAAFKGGWRGTGIGQLVHQGALLTRGNERLALVVLTDGSPSMGYGIETVRGVATRLLASRS